MKKTLLLPGLLIFSVLGYTQITVANNNNVGIGTAKDYVPSSRLEVLTSETKDHNTLLHLRPTSGGADHFFQYDISNNPMYILQGSDGVNKVGIYANGTTYFNGGNVGIGITTPTSKFSVKDISGSPFIADFTSTEGSIQIGAGGPTSTANKTYGNYIASRNSTNTEYKDLGFKTATGVPQLVLTTSGKVGIGTTNPTEKLDVNGHMVVDYLGTSHSSIRLGHNANDRIISDNASQKPYGGGYFFRVHNEAISYKYIDVMMLTEEGKVGIGTRTPTEKLHVGGNIKANKLFATQAGSSIPDYVFQKYYEGESSIKVNYTMPTLEEVEAFTKEHKHLPEVPSYQEVQKQGGVDVGQMTNILLQKIEELTLYTIEQQKQLKEHQNLLEKQQLLLQKQTEELEKLKRN